MPRQPVTLLALVVVLDAAACVAGAGPSDIADLTTWTLVEDPASPSFGSTVDSPTSITLTAADASPGVVPAGTDIGYQSVDADTAALSTSGFAFDPAASFSVAIDYDADFTGANAGLSFGFGIGEDGSGVNSAGVAFVTQDGLPAPIPIAGPAGGAARVNDSTVAGLIFPPVSASASSLEGSMHAAYDADTGAITVGIGPTGAIAPTNTTTFASSSVHDNWAGVDMLVSFFIRSDTVSVPIFGTVSTPWSAGEGAVVFTNLRVTSGAARAIAGCPCDWNQDGDLNDQDFFDWVNDFFSQAGPQGQFDFNQDTFENDQDWFDFTNCFFGPPPGC